MEHIVSSAFFSGGLNRKDLEDQENSQMFWKGSNQAHLEMFQLFQLTFVPRCDIIKHVKMFKSPFSYIDLEDVIINIDFLKAIFIQVLRLMTC